MSNKKRKGGRNRNGRKPAETASVPARRNRRPVILAFIGAVAITATTAVWLWPGFSGPQSEAESAAAGPSGEATSAQGNTSPSNSGGPSIFFPEPSFEFGTIAQGDTISHTFAVHNTGDAPLKLIEAKAS